MLVVFSRRQWMGWVHSRGVLFYFTTFERKSVWERESFEWDGGSCK